MYRAFRGVFFYFHNRHKLISSLQVFVRVTVYLKILNVVVVVVLSCKHSQWPLWVGAMFCVSRLHN